MENYYSAEKNVQMLVSLMQAHGVKKVVVSPGMKNMCVVGSFQCDPYFEFPDFPEQRFHRIRILRKDGMMKIAVAGTGYVGLSNAVLLAQHNTVFAVDIVSEKVDMLNKKQSPIQDKELCDYLKNKELQLIATTDGEEAYRQADFIIISTPTNYDPQKNYFDTSSVESVIEQTMRVNPKAYIVVKSTVPVGFTKSMQERFKSSHILFAPEFLREGKAL